ncbi:MULTISPECIES: hypothetical protein [Haloprofundus]|uniref:hypothetical protein n=1 Tax=Haloprofundus TaxID=1911573 RepID=UPI000E43FC6D|nr:MULTISPECIES: hypothetical protein [Haloprofundus]QCJ47522.1 hypothetical protein FCF25_10520 [Haloprofundus sp. MHR1]
MSEQPSLPLPSDHRIERTLALALLSLLGLYAVGSTAPVPTLDSIGVVAVHLAVVVGCLLPTVVLLRSGVDRFRGQSAATDGPSRLATRSAIVAFAALSAALVLAEFDSENGLVTALFVVAIGALLLLAGVLVRPDRNG